MKGIILVVSLFLALLAFIALAPRELKRFALAWTWVAMAVGAVMSVGVEVIR
ncbi:MAG: hypothetical protein WC236_13720 [Gallionellaceae bacterium]|jgi:hypothetical protein